MAGNTKLRGFAPEGKVQLERWGARALVDVGEEAAAALREACQNELPSQPPTSVALENMPHVDAGYDYTNECFVMRFTPEGARRLLDVMRDYLDNHAYDGPGDTNHMVVEKLDTAIKTREDYLDKAEPGLQ